ncbi:MAG: hypothetical protein NT062_14180 [Proteobacteria bacterium]|nr:hypothetical protein [Pseudomonadota bacterium]
MSWLRAFVVVGFLVGAAPASADEAPWVKGVTDAQKQAAQHLLEEGNSRFVEKDYKTALEKYRGAVAQWDHPAIRFNIVRCLIFLDQPIEAFDELKLALKYDAAPLEDAVYREALSYQKLLSTQIGEFELKCDQPQVEVTLDGKKLWDCPHSEKRRFAPGAYQLVGSRPGYLTRKVEISIVGGKVTTSVLTLDPREKAARIVHRYPTWMPWAVFGGGLVVAGIGGLLDLKAAGDLDNYDSNVAGLCAERGCAPTFPGYNNLRQQEDSALLLNKVAVGVMVAGAATAVVGGVMIFLNRGQTVYSDSTGMAGPPVAIVPTTDGGALATFSGSF